MNKKQRKAEMSRFLNPVPMSIDNALDSAHPLYEITRCLSQKSLVEMTEPERIFYLVQSFQADVLNGGLHQVLTNSTGEYIEMVKQFAHVRGLDQIEKVLTGVISKFPNGVVPENREARMDAVCAMAQSEYDDPFEALTLKFYECEGDLTEALIKHATENRDAFHLGVG